MQSTQRLNKFDTQLAVLKILSGHASSAYVTVNIYVVGSVAATVLDNIIQEQ